ncbi:MAG: carbon monoxide dehydrogenase subunit G [Chloroflexi bacterium]|nr:carbon monoxide dehydrogenase subunit G [Chloroflexota bacterium]
MKVSGEQLISAPRDVVWRLLMDPAALRRTIPGCQSFELRANETYTATLLISVGPIKGRFSGTLAIQDRREPESYTMALEGQGPTGFVRGTGHVTLTEGPEGTRVQVQGEAQVGGILAQVGSRMIETGVRMLMNQFFSALGQEAQQAAAGER